MYLLPFQFVCEKNEHSHTTVVSQRNIFHSNCRMTNRIIQQCPEFKRGALEDGAIFFCLLSYTSSSSILFCFLLHLRVSLSFAPALTTHEPLNRGVGFSFPSLSVSPISCCCSVHPHSRDASYKVSPRQPSSAHQAALDDVFYTCSCDTVYLQKAYAFRKDRFKTSRHSETLHRPS